LIWLPFEVWIEAHMMSRDHFSRHRDPYKTQYHHMRTPKKTLKGDEGGRQWQSEDPVTMAGSASPFPDDGRHTLNLGEAARILGVSRAYAYAAARNGSLPAIRIGRRWLVSRKVIEIILCGPASLLSPSERNRRT